MFCNNNTAGTDCEGFDFSKTAGTYNVLADANYERMRINAKQDNKWDFGVANAFDLLSVTMHEAGHTLGLLHSSVSNTNDLPIMWPSIGKGETRFNLRPDDTQVLAVSPYTHWRGVTGAANEARDIGASALNDAEPVAGEQRQTGRGFGIQRWQENAQGNGGSWDTAVSGGGVRIDVKNNIPWMVTSQGLARERTGISAQSPNGTGWTDRGDCDFIDIGAASNGVIWALGGTINAAGNYDVYRYNTGSGTSCNGWLEVSGDTGDGVRIDVSPVDGSPWVIAANGGIFHRNGVSGAAPTGSSWSNYGGLAADVSVGPEAYGIYGALWIVGHPSESREISLANIQSGVDSSNPPDGDFTDPSDVPERNGWFREASAEWATSITAGRNGMPWVIGAATDSFRRRP